MEYSKAKKDQLVLVTYHAQKGKDKDKLIDVFVGKIKGKVRESRTLIRVGSLQKGLGYDPETNAYVGCQVDSGWFAGKPIVNHGEILESYDQYHCKEVTLFNSIMDASNKLHQLAPGMKPHRVYMYRSIAMRLRKECHVEMACINTQDITINGVVIRLHSIDRKKSSDWIWFSCFIDPKKVEEFMLEYKQRFLNPNKKKR